MDFLRKSYYIFQKDLQSEWRTKQVLTSVLIFSLLAVIIISFAFNPTRESTREITPGIIWVAFSFAGILGLNRSFAAEKMNDCLLGLMLCPTDRSAIYLGKVMANLLFLLMVESVSLPVILVLYNVAFTVELLWLLPLFVMASFGFIAIGVFLAALSSNTRSSEILLPIILFPLLVPLVIAAVEATKIILAGQGILAAAPWIGLIFAYELIFFAVPFLLFEYLLEV